MAEVKGRDDSLERLSLWFVCQGKASSLKLYSMVTEDHYANKTNLAVYRRLRLMLKKNNEIMTWDDVCDDTSFPDASRLLLKQFDRTSQINKQRCYEIYNRLEEKRKIRVIYTGTRQVIEEKLINAETLDIEAAIDELAGVVQRARSQDNSDNFYIFGKNGNIGPIVEEVLNKGIPTMPTGIKAWDNVNGGLPYSSVVLLGANSGGGKSMLADWILHQCSENGAKTCFNSFEMDIPELVVRGLAREGSVDQGKIFTNAKLKDEEKKKLQQVWTEKEKRWAKEGKSIHYNIPRNNPSLEELLVSLKPYGFNFIVIDYITLLRDMHGDNQWQKLVDGVNFAKSYARNTGCTVIILVQITEEQKLKYAKGMIDGADLVWFFTKDQSVIDTGVLWVNTEKARKQKAIKFPVKVEYEFARISNLPDDWKPPKAKDIVNKDIKKPNGNPKQPQTKNDALMQQFFGSKNKAA